MDDSLCESLWVVIEQEPLMDTEEEQWMDDRVLTFEVDRVNSLRIRYLLERKNFPSNQRRKQMNRKILKPVETFELFTSRLRRILKASLQHDIS